MNPNNPNFREDDGGPARTPSRFDYVQYDDLGRATQADFKESVTELEKQIENFVKCPRSKAKAISKLEEVYMWVGKGIRNDQIERNGSAPLQEGRTDS